MNLVTRIMVTTAAVTSAPKPFSNSSPYGRGCWRSQCTQRPAWANVKERNTPTAYSEIKCSTLPWNATISPPAQSDSKTMPLAKERREPRCAR